MVLSAISLVDWRIGNRADPVGRCIADRHYSRQKIGSPQFVHPGRCFVLVDRNAAALWVVTYPFAQYVQHQWAGAWINATFRNESPEQASTLIQSALLLTLQHSRWDVPPLGIVAFVDPMKVRPMMRRGQSIYGYCYLKAGWSHVGYTKSGLWVWQLLPAAFPAVIWPDPGLADQWPAAPAGD